MKQFAQQTLLLICLLIGGCAGTALKVQSTYAPMPDARVSYTVETKASITTQGLTIFRERLDSQLSASGLLASGATTPTRMAEISINNYYMRHGAARALAGIAAGADNMRSSIIVRDVKSNAVIGVFGRVEESDGLGDIARNDSRPC